MNNSNINKEWIIENGEGHWKVTLGDHEIHCDDSELKEVIKELQKIYDESK